MKFVDLVKNISKAVSLEVKTYRVKKAIDFVQSNGLKVIKDTPKPTTTKKGK